MKKPTNQEAVTKRLPYKSRLVPTLFHSNLACITEQFLDAFFYWCFNIRSWKFWFGIPLALLLFIGQPVLADFIGLHTWTAVLGSVPIIIIFVLTVVYVLTHEMYPEMG